MEDKQGSQGGAAPLNGRDTNSYMDANRLRKVLDLINVLHFAKIDATVTSKLTADQWKLVALCAGVNPPSDITVMLVVDAMKHADELKDKKVNAAMARSILGQIKKKGGRK